jgi:LPXTG-site transpeptidase (sortase) family protein
VWWQYANQVDFRQMYLSGSWNPTGAAFDNAFVIWEDFSDRSISKSDGAAAATPGSTVTYTITVSNAGPATEPSATVVDNFPSALTSCSTTSTAAGGASGNDPGPMLGNINDSGLVLPVGSSVTYTSVCSIDPAATGMLTNTATISGANADLSPGNDTATDSDTLTSSADVSITKTDGASAEVPGTDVTYTIVASNPTGPSLATGVTVSDTFPATLNACTWSSTATGGATGNAGTSSGNINDTGIVLPVGANVTYTANCDIDPSATGSLANTATITSAAADPVPGNNSATDTDTLDPSADIAITKTDGSASAVLGATVTYTIVASNAGPSTPTDVTVSDNFPATLTSCSTTSIANGGATGNDPGPILGALADGGITLPPGADVTYVTSCTVDPGATGTIDNAATITSAMTDTDPGNNSATDTDTIQWIDLAITKSGGGVHVPLGGTASYTLTYSNNGFQGATGVTITDTVPAYTTFNAAGSTAGWVCLPDNNAGSTCTLAVGAVAGSGSGSATFAVTVTSPLPPGTTQLANTASIADDGANGIDPVPGNNSSADTTVTFDNSPPTVAALSLQSSYIAIAPDVFTVTFSEAVSNAGGGAVVDDAANPGNYLIVEVGDDDVFQTLNCLSGVAGDDVRTSASSVDYDPGTFTATVNLVSELPVGEYRLFICGTTSIVDLAGNALAGNGTTSGTDYSFDFVVIPFHPKTGFAPNRVTSLPPQPADQAYTSLGDLWLEIPRLGVKASIVGVPQSSEGWEVKWLGKGIGWLNGTAFPTWQGNSVLTAHAYDAEGLPGPFVDLPKLQYGDQVIIHMNGQKYIFEVRATRLVKANNATFAFEHLEGYPYLTLITCQNYDPQTNSYRSRRVVRAVLVEVKSE